MMSVVRWLFPFAQGLGLGVIAMLLHECGHLIAALILGVHIKSVGIKWNKGIYTIREKGTPFQNLLIAAAGPFTNIVFILTARWIPLLGLANLCYALANMLPIEGSDGYRIAVCWQQLRSHRSPPPRPHASEDEAPGPFASTPPGTHPACAPGHLNRPDGSKGPRC